MLAAHQRPLRPSLDRALCCCALPVHTAVHAELGDRWEVPAPSAPDPRPAHLLFVCDRGGRDLLVVGVAEPWEVPHSARCDEDGETVWVVAHTARSAGRSSGMLVRRAWVAEVRLARPLGSRLVRCGGPGVSAAATGAAARWDPRAFPHPS